MEAHQTLISSISLVIENIFIQLLAFQESIAAREEGQRFPTIPELNMQCRLINSLDKMRRYLARMQSEKAVTGFLNFVSKQDKALGNTLAEKYAEYTSRGKQDKSPEPVQQTEQVEQQPVKTGNEQLVYSEGEYREPVPFSEDDFHNYKHHIGQLGDRPNSATVNFNGRQVNARWLEYNLFQYTLPPAERRFIEDVTEAVTEANKRSFHDRTKKYLYDLVNIAA